MGASVKTQRQVMISSIVSMLFCRPSPAYKISYRAADLSIHQGPVFAQKVT